MLSQGCRGLGTFEQDNFVVIAVPPGVSEFNISIFDGDTGAADSGGLDHWDTGSRSLSFSLFVDPFKMRSTDPADLVGEWLGNDVNPVSGPDWDADQALMPDNDWWNLTVTVSPDALAPSGNAFYNLLISTDGDCAANENLLSNYKLAVSDPVSFQLSIFGFEAALRAFFNDGMIIYPEWDGSLPGAGSTFFLDTPTTYDGTFSFQVLVEAAATELVIIDGDFDHGSDETMAISSGVPLVPCVDEDDPDTEPDYANVPDVDSSGANPEGVNSPGSPKDDNALDLARRGEPGDYERVGCARYEVTAPDGTVYRNDNPSGQLEWEQFRIATRLADDPNNSDYGPDVAADGVTFVTGDTLEAGIWQVEVVGLDLANLNFWFFDAVCSVRDGVGGCASNSFLVGDTIFLDRDGDGIQGPSESGIPGVLLNLYRDPADPPLLIAQTGASDSSNFAACQANNTGNDEDGLYCFGVDDIGDYSIEVAAENFLPGGALEGFQSTTGGELQSGTVTDGNVLSFDFGYFDPDDVGGGGTSIDIPTLSPRGAVALFVVLLLLSLARLRRQA